LISDRDADEFDLFYHDGGKLRRPAGLSRAFQAGIGAKLLSG
jgi:hypothetical protein